MSATKKETPTEGLEKLRAVVERLEAKYGQPTQPDRQTLKLIQGSRDA